VWIGGRFTPPFFITDRDEPYRATFVLWMELPAGLIVGQELTAPENVAGSLGRALLAAIRAPLVGPPRRPARLRVADPHLAAEIRAVIGDAIPVDVAPTSELDAVLDDMLESMPQCDEAESYLEGGRLSPALVGELFAAADLLYRIGPWKVASDSQVLRMDIPALGVDGACVSIIGALGENLGLVIFPSLAGFEAFVQAADALAPGARAIDIGTDWLALSYARGADLPAGMRREAAAHGWAVADTSAYPRVDRRERDGASRPLVERDLRIAAACAAALSAFFAKHRDLFEADEIQPVCESYTDDNDLTVRFTLPYEAFPLFAVPDTPGLDPAAPAAPAGPAVGRNARCPCGSGKKYKKCHLALDEAARAPRTRAIRVHDLDARLALALSRFATARFGAEWERFQEDFALAPAALPLAVPWSVYCFRVHARTVLDWYVDERGQQLDAAERSWLDAQRAAWLSVWEVSAVQRGRTVTVRDLLSDEVRCVQEVSGSQTLVARDAVLARVVDHEDGAFFCGTHPRPLPPVEAAEVVRRARGRLRRKGAVPTERLRNEPFGRYLIRRWEEAVDELDRRRSTPPEMRNTDGEPLLLTTDHFAIAPGARAEVEARLATLDGVQPRDADENPPAYVFLRPGSRPQGTWENTVIARASVRGDALRLEANSRERADALRRRIEAACGDLVHHRMRDHSDPMSRAQATRTRERAPAPPPPGADQLVLDFKQRHYADWLDQSIPALGGLSPREAVRSPEGCAAVDLLLKDMENQEQRWSSEAAFDFSQVRRALQIP
jgi:hypothetical protein